MSAYQQSPAIAGMQKHLPQHPGPLAARGVVAFLGRGLQSASGDELSYRAGMNGVNRTMFVNL
jgi:hypothetical protein